MIKLCIKKVYHFKVLTFKYYTKYNKYISSSNTCNITPTLLNIRFICVTSH